MAATARVTVAHSSEDSSTVRPSRSATARLGSTMRCPLLYG